MTYSKSIKGSTHIEASKTVPIPTITLRSGQTIADPTFRPIDWREIPTPRNVGGTEQQIEAVKDERERLLNALPMLSRHQDADGLPFVYLADLEALILDEDRL